MFLEEEMGDLRSLVLLEFENKRPVYKSLLGKSGFHFVSRVLG